jgi:hypothetical protein
MSHAETLPSSVISAATATRRPRRVLRRIGAVAAGLVAIFAATTAADIVMHAAGVFPPVGAPPMSSALFLLAFAYRVVFDVGGCWLTARLAPDRPMGHAMALGGIGVLLSVAGAVVMWGAGPMWYPIALAVSALPCAWLGGRLRVRYTR